jgi:hypothetical protein
VSFIAFDWRFLTSRSICEAEISMSKHLYFATVAPVGVGHKAGVPQSGEPCPHCGFEIGSDDCTCYGLAGTPEERLRMQDEWPGMDARPHNRFTASVPVEAQRKIASMGLTRVAGNVYECPSTQDFWQVTGGGKIMRLSGDEVDNGESIPAAPQDKPMEFLSSILDDLSF